MTDSSFSIRSLAKGGTTLDALRKAVFDAPPGANLVLLQMHAEPVRFPPVCPNCGQPATTSLRIQRSFLIRVLGSGDTSDSTLQSIDFFDVPFCHACLHRHRSEPAAHSPWTPLIRILSEADGFAGLVVTAIAFMFFYSAITSLRVFPLLLGCLPFSIGFWLMRSTWKNSRHMSLPKPTSVDLAVDFTPSIALDFEPNWRAFHFRSQHYAALFRQANLPHLWSPHSNEAQSAAAMRRQHSFKSNLMVGAVVVAILIWMLWQEVSSYFSTTPSVRDP